MMNLLKHDKDKPSGLRLFSFKNLLIMKMMAFLMIITGIQAVAGPSDAQNITLSGKNMPLREVFRKIRKQTDFQFFYKDAYLRLAQPVNLQARKASIEQVLDDCFARQPLSYKIVGDVVVVNRKPLQSETTLVQGLRIPVQGTVVDSASGAPLIGVTVQLKDGSQGTVTDANGHFSLDAPKGAILVVSYLGYKPREVTAEGGVDLKILLVSATTDLEQLVVVGYGTQKKVNVTGAISTIDAEAIESRSVNSAVQALQGLAPNLNVDASSNGGTADASMSINVRGMGSLSSSAPYILIDGVRATQEEFASLNPNNIANISVLKDAASAAIYGAQGAYGVILIETKSGKKDQDFTVNYSNSIRLKKRIFVPSSVSSLKFAEVANTASMNFSGQRVVSEEQMQKIRDYMAGKLGEYGTAPDPNNANQWLGIGAGTSNDWYTGYANNDWWDIMYKDIEVTQKHDISIMGGGDKVTYYLGGGFFHDPGQLDYGGDNEDFKRYTLNSNIAVNVTQWLKLSNITRFSHVTNNFPTTLEMGSRGRLYHDIMRWIPLAPAKTPPIKDDEGNVIVPEQLAHLTALNENNGFNDEQVENLVSTFKAEIKINPHLSLKGDFTFKKNMYNRTLNFKKWTMLGPDGQASVLYNATDNQIRKDWRKTDYTSFNVYVNYDKTFLEKHNLALLIGYQQEENKYEQLLTGRKDVVANDLSSINVSAGDIIGPENPMSAWATMGAFGRLAYNYNETYLFEFNGRYDGSSKFAPNRRFGFFPSVSVGYNIDKENFWEGIGPIVNHLKIRASWGELGNQNVSSNLYLSSIPISAQLPWIINGERPVYTGIPDIISPYVTWETSTTKNIGADLGFLNYRLSVSFDLYQRRTKNMFGPVSALPAVLGIKPPETNSASLKTKGWELVVGWQDEINDLKYNVNFMLSDNRSYITQYNNPEMVLGDWYVGQQIGEIWGFEANKLFQSNEEVSDYLSKVDLSYLGTNWQAGDVKYIDRNGDGKVDVGENTYTNPGDQFIIGNDHPRYRVSLQLGASWKNFDINMLWQGIAKRDVWLDDYATLFWGWNRKAHSHITEASLDYWSVDNPNGYLPLPLDNNGRAGFGKDRHPSTRYLQSGAYVRLKSLNIGYTFKSDMLERWHIRFLKVYLSGENLLTLTKLWPTLDPELAVVGNKDRTSDGRDYPLAQVYSVGVNISL